MTEYYDSFWTEAAYYWTNRVRLTSMISAKYLISPQPVIRSDT